MCSALAVVCMCSTPAVLCMCSTLAVLLYCVCAVHLLYSVCAVHCRIVFVHWCVCAVYLQYCVYTASSVRLVGGSDAREGRVEVLYRGQWGTVCDDNLSRTEAAVICSSLHFGNAYVNVRVEVVFFY